MKPDFRICPQCATRNRLDKEFCVKCGEPLEGVEAGDPSAKQPDFVVSEGADQGRNPLIPLLLVIVAVGALAAGWQVVRTTPLAPETSVVAAPQVSSVPSSTPAPMAPGVKEYTEGMAALRAARFDDAVKLLGEAVAADNRADYRLGLAEALEKSGSTAPALAEYAAAASLDNTNSRYASEWAKALSRAGRNTEAIQAYEEALQIDGENLANLREVASLHLKGNDFEKARPYLEKVVQLQPDDLAPKQSLARALDATRDLDGAARLYREILAALPSADVTRALLSDVLMRQTRSTEALQLLDEGLRADPGAAILYREKGRVFDRLGRRAEAVSAYQQYVRLAPGAADARIFTARIQQLGALGSS